MQNRLANCFAAPEKRRVWRIEDGFYAFREERQFGVLMLSQHPDEERWYDTLNKLSLEINRPLVVANEEKMAVLFSCNDENLRRTFAEQCCNLYAHKEQFLADPKLWWEDLKKLTGDKIAKASPSDFFAEFATWLYLKQYYPSPVTLGSLRNSHDIQSEDGAQHEVKSTTRQRNTSIIELANRLQAQAGDAPLYFYFCRLDNQRADGLSINDLIEIARRLNCDINAIEEILSEKKILPYSDERDEKFFIMDFWKYDGKDSRFPCITFDSFKEDVNRAAVASFSYKINLDALTDLREDLTEQLRLVLM